MMKLFFFILSWFCFLGFSQTKQNHDSYFYHLKRKNFSKAKKSIEEDYFYETFTKLSDILENKGQKYDYTYFTINQNNQKEVLYSQALRKLIQSYANIFYNKYEKFSQTKEDLIDVLSVSEKIKDIELSKQILLAIFDLYRKDLNQIDKDYIYYIKRFEFLIEDDIDYAYYIINYFIFQSKSDTPVDNLFHNTAIKLDSIFNVINEKSKLQPYYHFEKGIYYSITGKRKKAKKKYQKVLSLTGDLPYYRYINYGANLKLSEIYYQNQDFLKAFKSLNKTKVFFDINEKFLSSQYHYYLYGSKYYNGLKKHDSAYFFLKKAKEIEDKVNPLRNKLERSAAQIKYETEKKEKENLQLKQDNLLSETKRKRNQNLFYGALLVLLSGAIIAFLNLKNSRKKRQLAEQQKELEKQKNLTLIKEQEITTINAMIDGQEKERIRIAEDLHDNIGSVLATLKLHFENLKLNREKKHFNQEELYNKTEKLIDETYLKVRSIAHAKNAGVIANQGLLVAIKMMAEKISSANKIKIHVVDYGLDNRLENNIEIAVFRIIQELITNIIKHAEASEATINISLFDSTINIIIEDNGKGFEFQKTKLKNGMGISSIQKRIKHLQGTFQVDSTLNKGTSIIINIPLS